MSRRHLYNKGLGSYPNVCLISRCPTEVPSNTGLANPVSAIDIINMKANPIAIVIFIYFVFCIVLEIQIISHILVSEQK